MGIESQKHTEKLVFFIEWAAVNVLGFSALNIIVLPVLGILAYFLLYLGLLGQTVVWFAILAICGLAIGILQWRVVRNFINQPSILWIFSAVLGCVIAGSTINVNLLFGSARAPEISQSTDLTSPIIFAVLVGLISSTLQLFVIPVQGYRILAWVVFNALIGAVVLCASALALKMSQFAGGPVAGILVGILTGALWLWMLDDNSEEPSKV